MADNEALYRQILTAIGESELERVKLLIGSSTLREAIYLAVYASLGQAKLIIPHYWAVYYHDGRGRVSPVHARKIVFFADPLADDPRLDGAYSVRAGDTPRLTRDQYEHGLEMNAERKAAGLPPFMFVLDSVGPSKPHPFFDQLANNAGNRATGIVRPIFDDYIQNLVDNDEDLRPETGTAEFTL